MNKKEMDTIEWRLDKLKKLTEEKRTIGRARGMLNEEKETSLQSLTRLLSKDFEELGAFVIRDEDSRIAVNLMLKIFRELKAK